MEHIFPIKKKEYFAEIEQEGKNPFILDSKEPTESFKEFIGKQVRYTSLKITFPEIAEELYDKAEQESKARYKTYKMMAERVFE